MSLRMNERFPIHNACRWEQLWRQREFGSPVREGINQIRACRFWRGIPEPTSQETRVPISPTSVGAELLRFAVPPTTLEEAQNRLYREVLTSYRGGDFSRQWGVYSSMAFSSQCRAREGLA